jgi:MoaA/NifB/PqqE/SkfB family radical SAM enzyme
MSGNDGRIDLEITTRCRLECPKCSRTVLGKSLKIKDMSLIAFRKIAESGKYKAIFFGGTYGDCIYHPNFYDIIKIAKENKIHVTIHTNGSGKQIKWWESIIQLLEPKDRLNFAMDGFNETVGEYRVNFKKSDFEKNIQILDMAKNKYGITTIWTFIPMRFNEHQIQQAAELAMSKNIIFIIKKSNRWFNKNDPHLPKNLNLISGHSRIFEHIENNKIKE